MVVCFLVAACSGDPPSPAPSAASARLVRLPAAAAAGASTIAAADYLGPDACGECHPTQHAQWTGSWHRVMNQRASDARAVLGDFTNAVVSYAGGTATFSRQGADYVMTLARAATATRYRVTRTIGRRALQEYVGIEEPGGTMEVRLPFGWWPRLGGWFAQPYFDPWIAEDRFDPFAPIRESWAARCPWCHSTYPFERRVARSLATGTGNGFEQLVALEAPRPAAGSDPDDPGSAQVTVGISCESCHLGGRAHASGAPIHFVPTGVPLATAVRPTTFAQERVDARVLGLVCAQCHTGSTPFWPSGAAMRNSAESTELGASACTTARCTDCHDPHTGGSAPAVAVAACVRCHERYAAPEMAASHAGAGHADATCLDCHMPRITMGVDRVVRSHLIGAPTDARQLAAGAPNACSLCHLDRSTDWLAAALHAAPARRRRDAHLDREAPLGEVWLASPEPALRIVAADAYARSPLGRFAEHDLLARLDDPLPHVRVFVQFAVEALRGRRLTATEYDSRAPPSRRKTMVARLRAATP